MKTCEEWWAEASANYLSDIEVERDGQLIAIGWKAAMEEVGILAHNIPPGPQHGREPKSLAQHLSEHVAYDIYGHDVSRWGTTKWRELLEQALEAYQSTENVTIIIERK